MKVLQDMDIGELAAFICNVLSNHGIECVLTGGACVSIYSNNRYQSGDLDFIETGESKRSKIKDILSGIGFEEYNRYFKRKDVKYFIEFPSGPLSIASERVNEISEIEFSTGILKLLSPTDCVKDRLAAYYFWDDKESLEQAYLVATVQEININEIARWSKKENCTGKFNQFKKLLIKNKNEA